MKKIFLYVCISCFIAACEVKSKTTDDYPSSTVVSVIPDITDPLNTWPTADQILQLFHCKQTPDAECLFRLRTISDKRLSPIITYRLASAENMEKENSEDDPQFRNKNIVAFYTAIRKSINNFYKQTDTTQSLNNSECFRIIANELSFLAANKSGRCTLIIASNLMEKSDLVDCYATSLTNPKLIAAQLNRENLIPQNLSGISVIFLFNPRDRSEDFSYSHMIEAYKVLLQPTGATTQVQANL